MDMMRGTDIAAAGLRNWRKLAQGLHARYLVDDFGAAAGFVAAIADAGDRVAHHPRVRIGSGYVDLELVTEDAVYREDDGTEHVVEWVTQQDVDLAREITAIADDRELVADPAAVSELELGLDARESSVVAPVWAALLTGDADSQGRGSPSDEVRDATVRVPNLFFLDPDENTAPQQRLHVEVYVAREAVEQHVAAAVASGGTVVDDSQSPGLTVVADPEGNRGIICADVSEPPPHHG